MTSLARRGRCSLSASGSEEDARVYVHSELSACSRTAVWSVVGMETVLNGARGAQAPVELITVHDFSEKVLEQLVHFHVMKLSGGFFLWIGSSPLLSNLALAVNSKHVSPAYVYNSRHNHTHTLCLHVVTWGV